MTLTAILWSLVCYVTVMFNATNFSGDEADGIIALTAGDTPVPYNNYYNNIIIVSITIYLLGNYLTTPMIL